MAKTIAVWGNSGSGVSLFCCMLAKQLTRDKKSKAIIISADQNTPMLPVWLPEQFVEANHSLGHLLTSLQIDTASVAAHVTVLKRFPFIGVMGYAALETPLTYPDVPYESIKAVIQNASRLVDFIILDCTTSLTNLFTPASIESADVVVRVLTPDLKGIHYLQAQQSLLADRRFKFKDHISLAGMARPYHAIEEMSQIAGPWKGILPYTKELDRLASEGRMFDSLGVAHKKYTLALELVVDQIREDQAGAAVAERDDGKRRRGTDKAKRRPGRRLRKAREAMADAQPDNPPAEEVRDVNEPE